MSKLTVEHREVEEVGGRRHCGRESVARSCGLRLVAMLMQDRSRGCRPGRARI